MRRTISLLVVLLMALTPFAQGADVGEGSKLVSPDVLDDKSPSIEPPPDAAVLLSNVDGFFTENKGQKGEGAGLFYCEGSPLSVAFGEGWVAYDYRPDGYGKGVRITISFVGANDVEPIGFKISDHVTSSFIGNDPRGWVSNARSYREILYQSLYEGIDLRFYFKEGYLKYDLIVAPHGDPDQVVFEYGGIEGLDVDDDTGDLLIDSSIGTLRDQRPVTFQDIGTDIEIIDSKFRLISGRMIGFHIASFNPDLPLVIDPGLLMCTYLGGSDKGDIIRVNSDENGSIYFGVRTKSTDFPVTNGSYDTSHNNLTDIAVGKLSENGSLIFSTFIGSPDRDGIGDFCVNKKGEIILVGGTNSDDFPTTTGAYQTSIKGKSDAFCLKLSSDGSRIILSTFIGGTDEDGSADVALDSFGNIYIEGSTKSADFPTTSGAWIEDFCGGIQDQYILKMKSDCSDIIWASYMGGGGLDWSGAIFVDSIGYCYFGGCTQSSDWPTTPNAYDRTHGGFPNDGVIVKMKLDGSGPIFSTFIGSDGDDRLELAHVDSEGVVYAHGYTSAGSTSFPVTSDAYQKTMKGTSDGFLLKLNKTGDDLVYSTLFGGSGGDYIRELEVDLNGDMFFMVGTSTEDYPITQNAYSSRIKGGGDVYVGRLAANGTEVQYGSYFGGSNSDMRRFNAPNSGMVRLTNRTVFASITESTDLPTTEGAHCRTMSGDYDFYFASLEMGSGSPLPNSTVPTEPQNLSAEPGLYFVDLVWDPPIDDGGARVIGYQVYRGWSEGSLKPAETISGDVRTFRDTGLIAGSAYFYAVSAINFRGVGNRTDIVNATPYGVPGVPPSFIGTPMNQSVLLEWNEADTVAEYPVLGYRLFRGTDITQLGHVKDLGNVLTYTDEGLVNGETYYYRLLAFNQYGDGKPSEMITIVPKGASTEPRYFVIKSGDGYVDLEWRAPLNLGGSGLIRYNILRSTSSVGLKVYTLVEPNNITFTDTDVENGVTYYYAVQAVTEVGNGPPTNTLNVTPMGTPDVPLSFNVESLDGGVLLSWDPPADDGGSRIIGYRIMKGTSPDDLKPVRSVLETTYEDGSVTNGETYYYSVQAYNNLGDGPATDVLDCMPRGMPDAPGDLIIEAFNGYLEITWLPPGSTGGIPLLTYHIYRGKSEGSLEPYESVKRGMTEFRDMDVEIGVTYYYAVTSETDAGESGKSIVVDAIPYGPPGVPKGLSATPGNAEVILSWQPPDLDGASRITGYVILRGTTSSNPRELVQLGEVFLYLDATVTNGETYHYVIAAINKAGPGEYSEPVSASPIKAVSVPGKVITLVADAKGAKVTLQWNPPQDDGGSPVTGYVVYRGGSAGGMEVVATLGLVKTWTDEDVERGKTYYYTVAPLNDVGEGEPFAAYEVKVPKPKEKGPGFEVVLVALAILLVIPVARRRA